MREEDSCEREIGEIGARQETGTERIVSASEDGDGAEQYGRNDHSVDAHLAFVLDVMAIALRRAIKKEWFGAHGDQAVFASDPG
ncbi:MAG: hypothetical protein QM651_05605 [Rhodoblastus sp.]